MGSRKRLHLVVILGVVAVALVMFCKSRLEPPAFLPMQAAQFKTAIANKNLDLIEKQLSKCAPARLTEYGHYINVRDTAGNTIMHEAMVAGKLSLVKLLAKAGAKVDIPNKVGRTPLLAAVGAYSDPDGGLVEDVLKFEMYDERADTVRWLIEHGADVHTRDNNNDTALLLAIRAYEWWKNTSYKEDSAPVSPDYKRVIRILLDNGADVNAANNRGQTPLGIARSHKDLGVVQLLDGHATGPLRPVRGNNKTR